MSEKLIKQLHDFFKANQDEKIVIKYSRYFKDGYKGYGISSELINKKADEIFKDLKGDEKNIYKVSRLLVKEVEYEFTSIAYLLIKKLKKQYSVKTFDEVSEWFNIGMRNWAHTDVVCSEIISEMLLKNVIDYKELELWQNAENKFKRRAVPVSIIKLVKLKKNHSELFKFITPMMTDTEREVHQGLGWFLREAWKINPLITEEFLLKWKNTSARLIFQYACEKMTPEAKQKFKKEKQ